MKGETPFRKGLKGHTASTSVIITHHILLKSSNLSCSQRFCDVSQLDLSPMLDPYHLTSRFTNTPSVLSHRLRIASPAVLCLEVRHCSNHVDITDFLHPVVAGAGMIAAFSTSKNGVADIVHNLQGSVPILIPVIKFSLGFPLIYHYLGGLRHLVS